jgi:hypothetical protein
MLLDGILLLCPRQDYKLYTPIHPNLSMKAFHSTPYALSQLSCADPRTLRFTLYVNSSYTVMHCVIAEGTDCRFKLPVGPFDIDIEMISDTV